MVKKHPIWKFLYKMRDFRSQEIFKALKEYCYGDVLDIGGWDFYLSVKDINLKYKSWTVLESKKERILNIDDNRYKVVCGDGCNMPFENNTYDVVVNIQVLEHVFEPIKMVNEVARVLKPSGYAIFLIPQTSILHLAPEHYYNFTKFWIIEAMKRARLEIVELKPLGGFWSTIASRLFHFPLQCIRFGGMGTKECKRSLLFYLLLPFMIVFIISCLPICMLFSRGDLADEPNNHFVLVRKK